MVRIILTVPDELRTVASWGLASNLVSLVCGFIGLIVFVCNWSKLNNFWNRCVAWACGRGHSLASRCGSRMSMVDWPRVAWRWHGVGSARSTVMQLQCVFLVLGIATLASLWPVAGGSPGPMFLSPSFCKVQGFMVEWMGLVGILLNAYIMAFLCVPPRRARLCLARGLQARALVPLFVAADMPLYAPFVAVPRCSYMTIMHEAATAKYELATSVAIWLLPLAVAVLPLFDVLGRCARLRAGCGWCLVHRCLCVRPAAHRDAHLALFSAAGACDSPCSYRVSDAWYVACATPWLLATCHPTVP